MCVDYQVYNVVDRSDDGGESGSEDNPFDEVIRVHPDIFDKELDEECDPEHFSQWEVFDTPFVRVTDLFLNRKIF